MNIKYFQSAGITVEVRSDFPISVNTFHPKFKKFEVDGPGEDNVLIQHHFHPPDLSSAIKSTGKEIYNKDQWQIFRTNDSWIYDYKSILPTDPGHCATGIFNEDYTSFSVHTTDFDEASYQNAHFSALTLFNTDQVMFAPLLCDRKGLILHANGFNINGKGLLLVGASGIGKSTLSSMLKTHGYQILCDDRMFITYRNSVFWIHGHWCHGTVPDTAPGSVPLKAMFFLEQSTDNVIEKTTDRREISHHLLRGLVRPILSPTGWGKTFDIVEAMAHDVACYRLRFDLSGDICQIIYDLLN